MTQPGGALSAANRTLARLPLIGGLLSAAGQAGAAVVALPVAGVRAAVRAIVDALVDELAVRDLTGGVITAVDLNRVLATVDLQPVLAGIDLNQVLAQVDLNALLQRADLDALLTQVDLNALLTGVDLNALLDGVDLNELLAQVDLNPLLARLDLNSPLAVLDLNALLASLDIDAILARTDLVGVAGQVVDGIDLNSIVRDASSTVTTEMISDVRTGSERADDRVEQFVRRVFRRADAAEPPVIEPLPESFTAPADSADTEAGADRRSP